MHASLEILKTYREYKEFAGLIQWRFPIPVAADALRTETFYPIGANAHGLSLI